MSSFEHEIAPVPSPSPSPEAMAPVDPLAPLDPVPVPLPEHQKVYDELLHYLGLKLQRPFTAPNIVMLVASGIKFLGKVKAMTGSEKKALVLYAVRRTVLTSSFITDKENVLFLIDTLGDGLVENLVEFALDSKTFAAFKEGLFSCCGGAGAAGSVHSRSAVLAQTHKLDEFRMLKDYLQLKLQRPITAPKVIMIIAAGVRYIEHYRDLSGAEKKDIVINAIREVIQESTIITDKDVLLDVVDTFADTTIDYLVDFGRKTYLKIKSGCCKK
jgi:hypothetical protein